MDRAYVNGVELEYEVAGTGEPVLLIHGALIADALLPLMAEPTLQGYRRIRYRRRGFGGSSRPVEGRSPSIEVQADDAIGLLDHLAVDRAHIVGQSLGGTIALEIAARYPGRVASVVALEPGLNEPTPASEAAMAALLPLFERYGAGDAEGAVHGFLALVGVPDWRATIERTVPGGVAQAVADARTWFEDEMPALVAWPFGPQQAAAVTCPMLSVLGTASGPLQADARALLHRWFTQCEDADIAGATHLLQIEAPEPVAAAICEFLSRHAINEARMLSANEQRTAARQKEGAKTS